MTRMPPLRRLVAVTAAVALLLAGVLALPMAAQATPGTLVTGTISPTPAGDVLDGSTVSLYEWDAATQSFDNDIADDVISGSAFSFVTSVNTSLEYAIGIHVNAAGQTAGYVDGYSNGTIYPPGLDSAGTLPGNSTSMDFGSFSVPAMHTASGYVYDENGDPVQGAQIVLLAPGQGTAIPAATTDVNGYYDTSAIPLPSSYRFLLGVAEGGYVIQFYSSSATIGAASLVPLSGPPNTDNPGFDFHLVPDTDRIDFFLNLGGLTGCGCFGPAQPTTTVHIYTKVGEYWIPVDVTTDQATSFASFVESNPGDYRLRFTDEAGNWLSLVRFNDTGSGSYTPTLTTDNCALQFDGASLGDEPEIAIILDPSPAGCGDEPSPPASVTLPPVHRATFTRSAPSTPAITPTPTPPPMPSVTESATPEPTVTTQTPSHAATRASVSLAWVWWLVGGVVLVLLLAGLGLFLFRRRV